MARSATGQMRIDYATKSVITNPASGETMLLDHVKKEVQVIAPQAAVPPPITPPGMPGIPGVSAAAKPPEMVVKDLGVKMVQGVEAQGHQITMPPLTPPKPPAVPAVPKVPPVPGIAGAPAVPAVPAVPKPPEVPMIAENWVSTKLGMPVLSRITGSFGQQICQCKNTVAGEPPASAFQVPADYKKVGVPTPPAPPAMPKPPAMPAAPAMPAMPKPPAIPGAPAMPAMPKPPAVPAAPAIPAAPKPPTFKL
jgi:hypothetical protein